MAITYDLAVVALDKFLQKKTTHGTNDIAQAMQSLCSVEFVSKEDQNDFANVCANFQKHVESKGITSIGRKQFEVWWDLQESLHHLEEYYRQEPSDPLPECFDLAPVVNEVASSEPCRKRHSWDNNECIHCKVQYMENEIHELRKKLTQIKGLANWD